MDHNLKLQGVFFPVQQYQRYNITVDLIHNYCFPPLSCVKISNDLVNSRCLFYFIFNVNNIYKLFGARSWSSLRVMSMEQRRKLHERIGFHDNRRLPYEECVRIARELNLSLDQVKFSVIINYCIHQVNVNACYTIKIQKLEY